MKTRIISKCIATILCFSPAFISTAAEKDTLNPYDVKFVKTAGQSSLNEVNIAELGVQKAQNPDVKLCASTICKDHNAILAEAKALAEIKGVTISGSIDKDTAQTFKELEQKTGTDFDHALVKHMDGCHIKSIKSFEDAQRGAKDADLKAWIDKTVVLIKAHHEVIKKLK